MRYDRDGSHETGLINTSDQENVGRNDLKK